MEKTYFVELFWYDYPIYLVYNLIISYILYRAGDIIFKLPLNVLRVFLVIFQLYFFAVVFDSIFNFLPFISDSSYYNYMISSGQYPQDAQQNLMGTYYVTMIFSILSLNSGVIFSFFCMMFMLLGLQFLIRARNIYYLENSRSNFIFVLGCLFYPALFFFSTAPLREGLVILSFGIFIYGLVIYNKIGNAWPFVTGIIFLGGVDFKTLLFIFPFLFFYFIYRMPIKNIIKVAIWIFIPVILIWCLRILNVIENFTPEYLSTLRNATVLKGGEYVYGRVEWYNYSQVFYDSVLFIVQFFLAPVPIFLQLQNLASHWFLVDLIFIILVLLFAKMYLFRNFKKYLPIVFICILWIICIGSGEYTMIEAVRNRIPPVLLLLFIVSDFISTLKKRNNA